MKADSPAFAHLDSGGLLIVDTRETAGLAKLDAGSESRTGGRRLDRSRTSAGLAEIASAAIRRARADRDSGLRSGAAGIHWFLRCLRGRRRGRGTTGGGSSPVAGV